IKSAKALENLDVELARETYLDAWIASFVAGPLAEPGGQLPDISRAARAAPPAPDEGLARDVLLDSLATVVIDGRAAGVASLQKAVDEFLDGGFSDDELVQWGAPITAAAALLWDADTWGRMEARRVELARASGALAGLSIGLNGLGHFFAW